MRERSKNFAPSTLMRATHSHIRLLYDRPEIRSGCGGGSYATRASERGKLASSLSLSLSRSPTLIVPDPGAATWKFCDTTTHVSFSHCTVANFNADRSRRETGDSLPSLSQDAKRQRSCRPEFLTPLRLGIGGSGRGRRRRSAIHDPCPLHPLYSHNRPTQHMSPAPLISIERRRRRVV